MNSRLISKMPFGELKSDIDKFFEIRTMNFEKDALIISGLNIATIDYQLKLQDDLPPSNVRSFEKYLLDEAHSFDRRDVKEIVEKFSLNNYFLESFGIHFFPEDSEIMMIAISPSSNDKKSFSLGIWDNEADNYSWEINIGDGDILVGALIYVCAVAKAIHNGKLSGFLRKMNMVNG